MFIENFHAGKYLFCFANYMIKYYNFILSTFPEID